MTGRRDGGVDSEIEQQLAGDDELFARMASGVEDEVVVEPEPQPVVEEVPEVEERQEFVRTEVEEDDPTNKQVDNEEEVVLESEEEVVVPSQQLEEVKLYSPKSY
jgi:hypothetical protein